MISQRTIGLRESQEMIRKLRDKRLRRQMTTIVANGLHEDTAPYAPGGIANTPANGYSWYVRGDGTHTQTGISYGESQDMINRWKVSDAGVGVRLTNTATYSGYAHDEEKQTSFHKARGWEAWQEAYRTHETKYLKAAAEHLEATIQP